LRFWDFEILGFWDLEITKSLNPEIRNITITNYKILNHPKTNTMKGTTIFHWILRVLASLIMLQTLYFKFTAHEQSVALFTQLGMEPWGRIGIGVMELIASSLILYPRTTGWGAALGLGLMSGALFFHLTSLGIEVDGDPILFIYALITFVSCLILFIKYRNQVLNVVGLNRQKAVSSKL
jgi:uncharacterized membrane protein YphA (DoxX/SURF4 family)